jgi:hypothetical protein
MNTKLVINPTELPNYLQKISYTEHGDRFEREYGHFLLGCFPNCEQFWRTLVVPFTKRMDGYPTSVAQNPNERASIDPRIEDLASANYSLFLNLVFAHLHLEAKTPSSFEDIYTHLGSVCDLAEMVIEKWYFIFLNLHGKDSRVLQELSRDEFLEKAGKLYDEKYHDWYQYYLQKGKSPPINLISRSDFLFEYLGKESPDRKKYVAHSQAIRQMRNVIVHDMKIARIIEKDGQMLIPTPKVIRDYRPWQKVEAAAKDQEIIKRDFAEQYQQAREDIELLEDELNNIWKLLIDSIQNEFYSKENATFRKMYNIDFSSATILDPTTAPQFSTSQNSTPSAVYTQGTATIYRSNDETKNS